MARKSGLGKGLDALIPGGELPPAEGSPLLIQIDKIHPNPRQPRTHIDDASLTELADSIREHGVIQPLVLRPGMAQGEYTLIAGERRLRAARMAGLEFVPAVIHEADDQQQLELALIENLQRADLTPLEAAEAYNTLVEDFGLSQEEVAARVGKSRAAVANTLRLRGLPDEVKDALNAGQITEGHARALLGLKTAPSQAALLHTVVKTGLNVRQTEELVRKLSGERPPRTNQKPISPEIAAIEEKLRDNLGTRVTLRTGKKGGSIVIHYYSDEELDSIIDHIIKE